MPCIRRRSLRVALGSGCEMPPPNDTRDDSNLSRAAAAAALRLANISLCASRAGVPNAFAIATGGDPATETAPTEADTHTTCEWWGMGMGWGGCFAPCTGHGALAHLRCYTKRCYIHWDRSAKGRPTLLRAPTTTPLQSQTSSSSLAAAASSSSCAKSPPKRIGPKTGFGRALCICASKHVH